MPGRRGSRSVLLFITLVLGRQLVQVIRAQSKPGNVISHFKKTDLTIIKTLTSQVVQSDNIAYLYSLWTMRKKEQFFCLKITSPTFMINKSKK